MTLVLLLAAFWAPFAPPPAAPGAAIEAATPVRDSLTHYYVRRDIPGVRGLRTRARTREERLMVQYRLFPMTMDMGVISRIPSEEGVRSAREKALIAALWAYKAGNSSKIHLPTYGRRSERILNEAKALNANEPYVLLVEGQSLLYKPGIFGGDAEKAKETFQALKRRLGSRGVPGIHPLEADIWIWMAERKIDRARAATLKRQLLARRPPPMFRQFLQDPP